MRNLLRTLFVGLLMMSGAVGGAMAQDDIVWSEDWSGNEDGVSAKKVNQMYAQTASVVVVKNTNAASGTAPEIRVPQEIHWVVVVDVSKYKKDFNLSLKTNRPAVRVTANGKSIGIESGRSGMSTSYSKAFSIEDDETYLTLDFYNSNINSNISFDDIVLKGTKKSEASITTIGGNLTSASGCTYFVDGSNSKIDLSAFSFNINGTDEEGVFSVGDNKLVNVSSDGKMSFKDNAYGYATINVNWSSESYYASSSFKICNSHAVTLNEDGGNIESCDLANITLSRAFAVGSWNTLCLPFSVAKSAIKSVFGEGSVLLELDTEDASQNAICFKKVTDGIEAGVPYLLKPTSEAIGSIPLCKIDVSNPTEVTASGTGVKLKGIYVPTDVTENGTVNAAGIAAGNRIVMAKAGGQMKGFRAYLVLPANADASSYMLNLDGTLTSIDKVNLDGEINTNAPVYNLAGQRVNAGHLPSGIYVQNGKKFVVK